MGKYTGMSFEKAFGMEKIFFDSSRSKSPKRDNAKQYPARGRNIQDMTRNQKDFCSYLSLDTYKDAHGNMRRELIALLIQKDGQIKVEELRRPDFSKIERYRRSVGEEPIPGVFPIIGDWAQMQGYNGDGYYLFFWRFCSSAGGNECDVHSDKNRPMRKIEAKDVISCLYEAAMGMNAGAAGQLSKLHDTLDKQLQEAGEDVFIYELLQNANDYPNGNEEVDAEFRLLKFKDGGGCLLFCHTGAEFTEKNVAALCSANDQDKSDNLSAIGYKGIGFKTVFRYNNRAEVRSGRFGFAFDKKIQEKKDGIPWRTTPSWVFPKVWDGYRVEIRLFPIDAQKLSDDDGSYSQQLRALFSDERPLLFIPRVRSVKLFLDDWNNPIVRWKDDDRWCMSGQLLLNVDAEIRKSVDDALKDVDHCRIPPKYRHLERTAVSFACRRDGKRLLPEDNANLYCYLPAKDAQWGFRFLMNTDMIPNGPRNDIEYSLEVNKYFAKVAGGKFFEWIDSLIRSGQYEYDSIFALIPDFEECIKGRNEQIIEFIKEFQGGFEEKLPQLQIPSSNKRLVSVSSIIHDTTGILAEMGESVWGHLGIELEIVDSSLRDSIPFAAFCKAYKERLGVKEFGVDDLLAKTSSDQFQRWLSNPMANKKFIEFLIGKNELARFKEAKIFLDDKGNLGCPQEMYFHPDVEKYLKDFSWCFRYLPSSAPCREKVDKDWFMPLAPKKLVCDILFSQDNENRVREQLSRVNTSRLFWGFLARYKTYTRVIEERYYSNYYRRWQTRQVSKQENRFSQEFLAKLPVVLDNGKTARAIVENNKSVFIAEQNQTHPAVSDYQWTESGWVGFIADGYFDWEEGSKVRDFFLEKRKGGNGEWQLVHNWNLLGILVAIADKFKGNIRQKMADSGSDLGFYDFIFKCIQGKCIDHIWIEEQLSGWPVLDVHGQIVDSAGKTLFYYDDELISWMQNGWLENSSFVVLNQKYTEQKELFDLLGVKVFAEGNFGELFKNYFSNKLLLDTPDKVIAFHHYLAGKRTSLSEDQASGLKNTSVLLLDHEGVAKGLNGVYIAQRDDAVVTLVESGALSRDIKVLDSRLCESEEMLKYWEWLGCKMLDSDRLMDEKIRRYLLIQSSETNVDEFRSIHKGFIREVIFAGGLEAKLKGVLLYDEHGKLVNPDMLVLGARYNPACDFQGHGVSHHYVSEVYLDLIDDHDKVKSFLLGLGVREDFTQDDVGCLSEISFCKYFWHDYVKKSEAVREKFHEWITPDSKCVLDGLGNIRAPKELYDIELADYVNALQNRDTKLPDVDMLAGLGFRQELSIMDCLDYLLTNPPAKMRGRVLVWLAQGEIGTEEQSAIAKYREDPNALWINGRGEVRQICELAVISHSKSGHKASIFLTDRRVLRTSGLGIDGMWEDTEKAFSRLGVEVIDDDNVEVCPVKQNDMTDAVRKEIAVRLLVFLMTREGDEGKALYDEKYKALSALKFSQCESISVRYKDVLQNNQRKFMSDGNIIYFVDGWQSKYVYGDVIKILSIELFKRAYSDDDLKVAFDTDGGIRELARKIVSDFCLHKNDVFMSKIEEVSSQLRQCVESYAQKCCMSSEGAEDEKSDDGDKHQDNAKQDSAGDSIGSNTDNEEPKEPEKHFTKEEEEQMFRIFGNGLTAEQMNDENRLVCIRLFNSLKAQGYEPRMLEADFVRDVYDNRRTFSASTIETNDGQQIHVISARGGVAYLPPRWWTRLAKPNNTKYVVCAVLNHLPDGFKYFRCRDDLLTAIGDNLGVIRVHGETAESRLDRTLRLFEFDPELSDFSIYSLLRVKATCDYYKAFREDMRFAESIGYEMGAEEEQDNNAY